MWQLFTFPVAIYRHIKVYILQHNVKRYQDAIAKANEAYSTIDSMKREVSDLHPCLRASQEKVRQCVANVEAQREGYINALDVCRGEESKIERLMTPLEKLREDAQAHFNKVKI